MVYKRVPNEDPVFGYSRVPDSFGDGVASGPPALQEPPAQQSQQSFEPTALPEIPHGYDIDKETGKPTDPQVAQWVEETPKGQKFKGHMDLGNGPQPVYGVDTKEDPAVTEQKLRQREARVRKNRAILSNQREQSRRERLNDVQKFTRSLVNQEEAGYMSRNKLNDREFSGEIASDPKVRNHPYASYSKRERDKFESEIAKGKDKRNLTGLSDYERDKTNYEATVRARINDRKGHEWEAKKFAQFDLQLEQQRLNLEQAKVGIESTKQNIESSKSLVEYRKQQEKLQLEQQRLNIEQTKVGIESTKQNIENSKSLVEYRKQQEKLKGAQDELARRSKLNKQLNDDSTTAPDAYRMVQEGGGVSKERAEAIAKRLPPAHRRAFVDKAVANMEEATKSPRDLLESYRTPDEGGGRAGKISSAEAAKVRKSAQEAKDAGISPKTGIRLAAESIGETGNPAAESAAIKGYSEPSENDVTAQRESEEYVAKQMDEYSKVIKTLQTCTDTISNDESFVDFILKGGDLTRSGFMAAAPGDVDGIVERRIMRMLSPDNENGRATLRTRLDSDDRSEESELVDKMTTRLKSYIDRQDVLLSTKADSKNEAITNYYRVPQGQFATIPTAIYKGEPMTTYTGGSKEFELIMAKHMSDVASQNDPKAMEAFKRQVGYDVNTGVFGIKGTDPEERSRIAKLNFTPPPEAVKALFKTEEGRLAVGTLWTEGEQYTREVIEAVTDGDFEGVLKRKLLATFGRINKMEGLVRGGGQVGETGGSDLKIPKGAPEGIEADAAAMKWIDSTLGEKSPIRTRILSPLFLGKPSKSDEGKSSKYRLKAELDRRLDDLANIDINPVYGTKEENKAFATNAGVKAGSLIRKAILDNDLVKRMWYSGTETAIEVALLLGMKLAEKEEQRKIGNTSDDIGRLIGSRSYIDSLSKIGLSGSNLYDGVNDATDRVDFLLEGGLKRTAAMVAGRMSDIVSEYYDATAPKVRDLNASRYRLRQFGGMTRFYEDDQIDAIRHEGLSELKRMHNEIIQSLDKLIGKKAEIEFRPIRPATSFGGMTLAI